MKLIPLTIATAILSSPIMAQDMSEYLWQKRPVLVFADSDQDPRFVEQMEYLDAEEDALDERDVVVLTDTDPNSDLRDKYHPRGFTLILVGKDGGIKLRKPSPWTVREISRVIDKMPMRQREIRNR